MELNSKNFIFDKIPFYLIILLPALLVSGPFLADSALTACAVIFLINSYKNNEQKYIPLIGKIAAGLPIEAIEDFAEDIPAPPGTKNPNDFFALRVEGDSMINAGINDGDTVIIRKTNIAENGKIVVALIDDHEATLKRYRKKSNAIALESANPLYEARIFNPDRIKIQGVLSSLYRNF